MTTALYLFNVGSGANQRTQMPFGSMSSTKSFICNALSADQGKRPESLRCDTDHAHRGRSMRLRAGGWHFTVCLWGAGWHAIVHGCRVAYTRMCRQVGCVGKVEDVKVGLMGCPGLVI